MDLSRQEYPAMLDSLQPSQAVEVLNNRVAHVSRLNVEIADWLEERRRVEESYAIAMRKLARKQPPGPSSDLGIFSSPWRRIAAATQATADSHYILAQKIEADVEKPLRHFAGSNREMQSLSTIQGNLAALANDVESAQRKADKAKDRDASRTATSVDDAMAQWSSQAPFVFEQLQAADETRCNHLRDVLTQYETHEADLIERNRVTTEQCLNALLEVNTADEVTTFVARVTGGAAVSSSHGPARPQVAQRNERTSSRSQPTRGSSLPIAPPIPSPGPENRRESSGPAQETEKPEKKSRGLQPFKRLGTVIKNRRQSSMPQTPPPPPSNTRTQSGLSQLRTPTQIASPPPTEEPESIYTPPEGPPPNRTNSDRITNGFNTNAPLPTPPIANGVESHTYGQLQEPLQPSTATAPQRMHEITTDAEGYSVPPPATDPISQVQLEVESPTEISAAQQYKLDIRNEPIADEPHNAEAAMADMAETLRQQATPSRRTTLRGRRDVRNTIYRESPPTMPSMPDSLNAEQRSIPPVPALPMASQPMMSPPIPSQSPSGGMIMTPFLASFQRDNPPENRMAQPGPTPRPPPQARTSTLQSPTMTTASTSMADKHADLTAPGITTSVVETVSCWFEHGGVTRAIVTGEVALSHNPNTASSTDFPQPPTEDIRLDNFSVLEKVAANPTFVSQVDGKPGEYTVNIASITGLTATAFKYQMHIDSSNLATLAPLTLTPTWRVEPTQTSVILAYGINPAYKIPNNEPLTITNVILAISLGSTADGTAGRAISCLSKPAGTFSKERGTIFWRLPEIVLTPGMASEKVLARFTTEGEAAPGQVDARWEVTGPVGRLIGSGLGVSIAREGGGSLQASSDPFADADVDDGFGGEAGAAAGRTWSVVEGVRRLVSGTYTAAAV